MMKPRRILAATSVAAILAAGPAFGATAGAAGATAQQLFQQAQQKVEAALAARQHTLADLTTSVTDNRYLKGDSTQQTLLSLLAAETQGINGLAAKVPADTTLAQLRQDAYTMVHQYRVYLVMAPQVHLSEAAAAQTAVEAKLTALEAKIQQAIAAAQNRGRNVTAAQLAYNDLVTQVQSAGTATPAADIPAVLEVTPSGYPGDAGPLSTARTQLHAARSDLQKARSDLQVIRETLRS